MLKRWMIPVAAGLMLFVSCDSFFIEKKSVDAVKAYEKKIYVMKKDMDVEGRKLRKGEDVRIVATAGKEWVKVHAYSARENELKADRVLILYLFDDDFAAKKFNMKFFEEQLNSVVAPRGDVPVKEKKRK